MRGRANSLLISFLFMTLDSRLNVLPIYGLLSSGILTNFLEQVVLRSLDVGSEKRSGLFSFGRLPRASFYPHTAFGLALGAAAPLPTTPTGQSVIQKSVTQVSLFFDSIITDLFTFAFSSVLFFSYLSLRVTFLLTSSCCSLSRS